MIKHLTLIAVLMCGCLTLLGQEPTPTQTPNTPPPDYRGPVTVGEETKYTVRAGGPPLKPISAGILNGKAVTLPKPVYPAAALAVRAAGVVNVQVLIDEEGNVTTATAVSGNPLLRDAAVDAARGAKFSPTRLSGHPVKVSGVITYNFVDDTRPAAPASGGIIPPEDKDTAWILGSVISMIRSNDPEVMEAMTDGKSFTEFLTELGSDVPVELKGDKHLFDALAKAPPGERPAAAIKLFEAIKVHLTEEQKWQAEVGTHIGNLMVEMKRVFQSSVSDVSNVKSHLRSINQLLVKPPAESSPELVTKFRNIGAFADSQDLGSLAKLQALWKTVDALIASIPD